MAKLHDVETVGVADRLAVPGGWLYASPYGTAFVPDPAAEHVTGGRNADYARGVRDALAEVVSGLRDHHIASSEAHVLRGVHGRILGLLPGGDE